MRVYRYPPLRKTAYIYVTRSEVTLSPESGEYLIALPVEYDIGYAEGTRCLVLGSELEYGYPIVIVYRGNRWEIYYVMRMRYIGERLYVTLNGRTRRLAILVTLKSAYLTRKDASRNILIDIHLEVLISEDVLNRKVNPSLFYNPRRGRYERKRACEALFEWVLKTSAHVADVVIKCLKRLEYDFVLDFPTFNMALTYIGRPLTSEEFERHVMTMNNAKICVIGNLTQVRTRIDDVEVRIFALLIRPRVIELGESREIVQAYRQTFTESRLVECIENSLVI